LSGSWQSRGAYHIRLNFEILGFFLLGVVCSFGRVLWL
jgi:hypothetical protein